MATRLSHTPAPFPHDPAQRDVDDLVAALHESGLLRALAGAVRGYPDIASRLAQALDPDSVRALAELGTALGLPAVGDAQRLADGVREGVDAAGEAASGEAPSLFAIVRELGSEDVRRAIGVVVAGLGAFGRHLGSGGRLRRLDDG